MNTVTLQGPVVVLPAEEYQALLGRLTQLENMVNHLTQMMEDLEDVMVMREAETEYRSGDAAGFADSLVETQAIKVPG
ncbi:MAG: hypothetical protein ACE5EY_11530 [Anaerolineae bacterium]